MFVRVQADVSDVNRKMRDIERALGGVDRSAKTAQLSTGRLGSQFANLASQIGHVHPIVGNLAQVLGNFAIGGAVTLGVLGGVALMAVAWDKLTESSRKAKEQTDKFIQSLVAQARAIRVASIEGLKFAELQADIELQAAKRASGVGLRSVLGAIVTGKPGLDPTDAAAVSKRIADAETGVTQTLANTAKAMARVDESLKTGTGNAAALAAATRKAAEFAERYAKYMYDAGQWTANISGMTLGGMSFKDAIAILERTGQLSGPAIPEVLMPDVGINDSVTKAQIKAAERMGILIDRSDKNTDKLKEAVWGSAHQLAGTLVNALNVGGGGRGSQIGGGIGQGIGSILGSMTPLGGVGGVLGGVIGGIAGSFFGGLFDSNKKEVNANTQALRANTQALLLYAPAGFKSESYRYASSDPRPLDQLGRVVRMNASRGGANPLLGAT